MGYGRTVAGLAGGTLGFITGTPADLAGGGVWGAVAGYKAATTAYDYRYPNKKMVQHAVAKRTRSKDLKSSSQAIAYIRDAMGKPPNLRRHVFGPKRISMPNVVNAQAHRASMKRKGSKNVRGIQGKRKKVKVSKKLRAKIKKVIDGGRIYGTYQTLRQGQIGMIKNTGAANNAYPTLVSSSYGAAVSNTVIGVNAQASARWWWAGLAFGESVRTGDEWLFFQPMKILDAASVLWNNKDLSRDFGLATGNLALQTSTTTGVSNPNTGTVPNTQGNKIHIHNSWVKFEMKNTSQRAYEVTIYNCVPKIRHPDKTPLTALRDGIISQQSDALANRMLIQEIALDSVVNVTDTLMNDPMVHPSMVPGFNNLYKAQKISMMIAPGETCVHYIKGPRNLTLDYNKFQQGGTDTAGLLYNKTSMAVMMALKPSLEYATVGASGTAARSSGRYAFGTGAAVDNLIQAPISMEVTEVFKLAMPESSGFYMQTITQGQPKNLSLRRPAHAFGNFTANYLDATLVYQKFDEEQPATAIPGSITA